MQIHTKKPKELLDIEPTCKLYKKKHLPLYGVGLKTNRYYAMTLAK